MPYHIQTTKGIVTYLSVTNTNFLKYLLETIPVARTVL
jgi:hypothetical protein